MNKISKKFLLVNDSDKGQGEKQKNKRRGIGNVGVRVF